MVEIKYKIFERLSLSRRSPAEALILHCVTASGPSCHLVKLQQTHGIAKLGIYGVRSSRMTRSTLRLICILQQQSQMALIYD